MGPGATGYDAVLVLHILSAIVGFGAVMLNGLYASQARQRSPEAALAITEANSFVSSKPAKVAIYLTAFWGFGLVGMSDGVTEFSESWIWISIVIFIAASLVSELGIGPTVKKLIAAQRSLAGATPPQSAGAAAGPPPEVAQIQALGKRIGMLSSFSHLALVVIVILMVFQPGNGA
jgi:hypothetical protein